MLPPRSPDVEIPWEVVSTAPTPLAVTDASGVLLGVNDAFCSLVGREEVEVLGRAIEDLLSPECVAGDRALMRRLLAAELEVDWLDQRYRRRDATLVPVRAELRIAGPPRAREQRHILRILRPLEAEGHGAVKNAAAIVASSGDAITAYSMDGRIVHWNPASERLYGRRAADMVGRLASEVLPDQWADDVAAALERVAQGERIAEYETGRPGADGAPIEVSLTVAPMTDEAGAVVGASFVARDITHRKRAESLLAGQARVVEMIAGAANLRSILDAVAELIEAHAGSARCSILLIDHELPGRLRHGGGLELPSIENVVEDVTGESLGGPYARAALIVADLATDPRCQECRHLALHLGLRSCWCSPIVAADSEAVLGLFALYYREAYSPDEHDWALLARLAHVAALAIGRHRSMEQLAHQALHDPLTGAANRTLVCERIGHALERRKREGVSLAVLFLDLDRFKALNDTYGHDTGDHVLMELTRRLRTAVRPADTVARLGGDEFVVLCEGVIGELEVMGIADRISLAVATPFTVDDKEVSLTASIGISVPRGGESPESLLDQADSAMYRAKEQGNARYQLFDTAMHERAVRRRQTEEALRSALRQGELMLVYQPLVNLVADDVVAVEALVRWNHPQRGLLPPAEFLGLAEDSGLIVPIGAWVIEEVCRRAAQWSDHGKRRLNVHVNVSARQLRSPELVDLVGNAVAASGVAPSSVCLEINETTLMGDAASALPVLHALKSLGLRLSIDDFGTGYSSLAHVDSFPIDELKIHRSFIADVAEDGQRPVVVAMVHLAHALGLDVVADGVERADQVEQLRRMGCDIGQGHYWSHPLLPHEVAQL